MILDFLLKLTQAKEFTTEIVWLHPLKIRCRFHPFAFNRYKNSYVEGVIVNLSDKDFSPSQEDYIEGRPRTGTEHPHIHHNCFDPILQNELFMAFRERDARLVHGIMLSMIKNVEHAVQHHWDFTVPVGRCQQCKGTIHLIAEAHCAICYFKCAKCNKIYSHTYRKEGNNGEATCTFCKI